MKTEIHRNNLSQSRLDWIQKTDKYRCDRSCTTGLIPTICRAKQELCDRGIRLAILLGGEADA